MGDKKQRIIPAHYSWNSSIFTRGVVDPIKRKLGWVDENERPVSLKESATGQELNRMKDAAESAGKLAATGLAFSNPVTASSTMAPLITGSQAYFISEGLKDAYNRVMSSNKTAEDGAIVALDVAGAVPGIKPLAEGAKVLGNYTNNIIKISNPKYRALHAYNSITPFGYHRPVERTKNWIKDMIVDSPVDIENPKWIKDARIHYHVVPGTIEFDARNSAYKKYLGIPDKNPMYIENPDGTFSYDLSKFENKYRFVDDKFDFMGGAHGHLWNDSGFNSDKSAYFMHDVWDLHPLSKGTEDLKKSLHKTIGSDKLRELAQNFRTYMFDKGHWGIGEGKSTFGKLTKFLDRPLNIYRNGVKFNYKTNEITDIPPILNNTIDKIVDSPIFNKIAKYEIGPVLGGKPFELKMNVPVKPNNDLYTIDLYQYITDFKQGGILKRVESGKSGIHIKPENRGKFTALKKRTGKSSTWDKEHGAPAQKKMAVFALNAKKWKHK